MTIAIFGNTFKPATLTEVTHILQFMRSCEVHVLLSQELRAELNLRDYEPFPEEWEQKDGQWVAQNGECVDFALSVGGDGTFLTTAAAIGNKNIPILGINCGHLGFLADVRVNDVDEILEKLILNEYTIEQRGLLNVRCSGDRQILSPNALNEIAILKQGLSSMISVETSVNGELLNTYDGDGLIIATSTGSTAYNLSVGGPLMAPETRAIILSPIAGHSLTARPLVIPGEWTIDLKIKSRSGSYLVSVDGRSQSLDDSVTLHIERAGYTIKLVQLGDNNFLTALKTKLNWGA